MTRYAAYHLASAIVDRFPSTFPLMRCAETMLEALAHDTSDAPDSSAVVTLCTEAIIHSSANRQLLALAQDALITTIDEAQPNILSSALTTLVKGAMDRSLRLPAVRTILHLFTQISGRTPRVTNDTLLDLNAVACFLYARVALTEGNADAGLVFFHANLVHGSIEPKTLILFTAHLLVSAMPGCALSISPLYMAWVKELPGWLPQNCLSSPSTHLLVREAIRLIDTRMLLSLVAFSESFLIDLVSLAISSRDTFSSLRQVVSHFLVDVVIHVERSMGEVDSNVLFNCLNALYILPLMPQSTIYLGLVQTIPDLPIGRVLQSTVSAGLSTEAVTTLKKARESAQREAAAGTIPDERARFCLWELYILVSGTGRRFYLTQLVSHNFRSTSPFFLYQFLSLLSHLLTSKNSVVSGLASRVWQAIIANVYSCVKDIRAPLTLLEVERALSRRFSILGLQCHAAARLKENKKPSAILKELKDITDTSMEYGVSRILASLGPVLDPFVPYAILTQTSYLNSDIEGRQSELQEYFGVLLRFLKLDDAITELELIRTCLHHFLLSGEGQVIERVMVCMSHALTEFIHTLEPHIRAQLVDEGSALTLLICSLIMVNTETMTGKVSKSSQMTENSFVSVLMGAEPVRRWLSNNFQRAERGEEPPPIQHEAFEAKLRRFYHEVRTTPIMLLRTAYSTLSSPSRIAVTKNVALSQASFNTPHSLLVYSLTGTPVVPVSEQILPLTYERLLLNCCTAQSLTDGLTQFIGYLKNADEIQDFEPVDDYAFLYLLIRSVVDDVLRKARGAGLLFIPGIFALEQKLYESQMTLLDSEHMLAKDLVRYEAIQSVVLVRATIDQNTCTNIVNLVSETSPGKWASFLTVPRGIGACSLLVSFKSFCTFYKTATHTCQGEELKDALRHIAWVSILLFGLGAYPQVDTSFVSPPCTSDVAKELQWAYSAFLDSASECFSALIAETVELACQTITGIETGHEMAFPSHHHLVRAIYRVVTSTGVDTGEENLTQVLSIPALPYTYLVALGSLLFVGSLLGRCSVDSLSTCSIEVDRLLDACSSFVATYRGGIKTTVEPIYTKIHGTKDLPPLLELSILGLMYTFLSSLLRCLPDNTLFQQDIELCMKRLLGFQLQGHLMKPSIILQIEDIYANIQAAIEHQAISDDLSVRIIEAIVAPIHISSSISQRIDLVCDFLTSVSRDDHPSVLYRLVTLLFAKLNATTLISTCSVVTLLTTGTRVLKTSLQCTKTTLRESQEICLPELAEFIFGSVTSTEREDTSILTRFTTFFGLGQKGGNSPAPILTANQEARLVDAILAVRTQIPNTSFNNVLELLEADLMQSVKTTGTCSSVVLSFLLFIGLSFHIIKASPTCRDEKARLEVIPYAGAAQTVIRPSMDFCYIPSLVALGHMLTAYSSTSTTIISLVEAFLKAFGTAYCITSTSALFLHQQFILSAVLATRNYNTLLTVSRGLPVQDEDARRAIDSDLTRLQHA
ncbi:hypothetical protein GMRT_14357 [Giardia muris]|uniref:SEC7 domain-containing protein n=1 Tax=Giardia muris TaxID=5742 RepID=A0A4Z1ST76_GIAMU|nr:hypothetical protein GMRT_14357 [Giardia muris]|eukprot:TNJ28205.1 hypothetical protein GMRT_14357 [Giardia muris]